MLRVILLQFVCLVVAFQVKDQISQQYPPNNIREISLGGDDAKKGEFPFVVSLMKRVIRGFNFIGHYCGGSLITHHTILTAAHCVKKEAWVIAGDYNLSKVEGTEQVRKVDRYKIHGKFQRLLGISINDIGLLYVEKPFVFNEFVRPIPLAKPSKKITKGVAVLAGWGQTTTDIDADTSPILQKEKLPILSPAACFNIIHEEVLYNASHLDAMICTGPFDNTGPCNGDSGSPFVMKGVLVGVASWATNPCGMEGRPAGFARVSSYIDWILEANRELRNSSYTNPPDIDLYFLYLEFLRRKAFLD